MSFDIDDNKNFSRWRHLFINSDFLLRGNLWSDLRMQVFSDMHSLHVPRDGWYVGAEVMMDHLILKLISFCFRLLMCFDKPVLSLYFSCLNDSWWLLKRSLNVFDAWPIYSACWIFTEFLLSFALPDVLEIWAGTSLSTKAL